MLTFPFISLLIIIICKIVLNSWAQWLIPVILGTWELKIGRIKVQGKPCQKFLRPYVNQQKAGCHDPCCSGINVRPYLKTN
jgi:hypothetical protein